VAIGSKTVHRDLDPGRCGGGRRRGGGHRAGSRGLWRHCERLGPTRRRADTSLRANETEETPCSGRRPTLKTGRHDARIWRRARRSSNLWRARHCARGSPTSPATARPQQRQGDIAALARSQQPASSSPTAYAGGAAPPSLPRRASCTLRAGGPQGDRSTGRRRYRRTLWHGKRRFAVEPGGLHPHAAHAAATASQARRG
jgi:hypothetical protein